MTVGALKEKIVQESLRIEEDCEHSAKGHYNSANCWFKCHYWIGIPMSCAAGIASATAFHDVHLVTSLLALFTAALGAAQTCINPEGKAQSHKSVAGQYLTLRNQTRCFREIELLKLAEDEAEKRLLEFAEKRDTLNENSPTPSRKSYMQAKKDIDEGLSQFRADQNSQGDKK